MSDKAKNTLRRKISKELESSKQALRNDIRDRMLNAKEMVKLRTLSTDGQKGYLEAKASSYNDLGVRLHVKDVAAIEKKLKEFDKNYNGYEALLKIIKAEEGSKPTEEQKKKLKKFANLIGTNSTNAIGVPYNPVAVASNQVSESETEQQKIRQSVIKPELGEQVYDKIIGSYIALKKGTNDQHMLAMYTKEIVESKPVRETWPQLTRDGFEARATPYGSAKKNILSLSNNIVTDRLSNAFNYKLKDVVKKDFEGFRVNPMSTLTSAQLSSLTPKVDFFLRDRKTFEIKRIPLQNLGRSSAGQTGVGAVNNLQRVLGLKELTIRMSGKDPETVKRDIDCSAVFYGNNLSVFDSSKGRSSYLSLIQPEGGGGNSNDQQLVIHVGWNTPSATARQALGFTTEQVNAIDRQRKVYIMYYYKHSFAFNADGSFTMSVDYVSALDEVMEDINIMADTEDAVKDFYNKLPKYPGSLSVAAKQAVSDYIKVVHPTVTQETRSLIYGFFKTVPDTDVTAYLEKHTLHFHQKNATKIAAVTNYLLRNNKTFKVSVQGRLYNRQLFNKAFERHVIPYFTGLDFKASDKMPPAVYSGTVAEYYRICNIKGDVFSSQPNETLKKTANNKTIKFMVTKLSVTPGTDGVNTFTEVVSTVATSGKKSGGKKEDDAVSNIAEGNVNASQGGDKAKKEAEEKAEKGVKDLEGKKDLDAKDEKTVKKLAAIELAELKNKKYDVYFFQFGDIIDAILKTSKADTYMDHEKFSILFGNLVLDYKTFKRYPIYKLPIALETYQSVMKKYQDSTARRFPLRRIVQELLSVVSRYYSNGDYVLDSGKTIDSFSLKTGQFKTTNKSVDAIANASDQQALYDVQSAMQGRNASAKDEHYIYHYSISPSSTPMNGVDAKNIVKYEVGNGSSLIKKISYKQVENPVLLAKQDQNVIAANKDAFQQLIPQMYNVDLTTVGQVDFEPGYQFYIKPSLIGVSDISWSSVFKQVGLTAVLNVLEVEHRISLEGYSTSFKCMTVSNLDWASVLGNNKPKNKREQRPAARKTQEEINKEKEFLKAHKKSRAKAAGEEAQAELDRRLSTNDPAAIAALKAFRNNKELRYVEGEGLKSIEYLRVEDSYEANAASANRSIRAFEKDEEAKRLLRLAKDTGI